MARYSASVSFVFGMADISASDSIESRSGSLARSKMARTFTDCLLLHLPLQILHRLHHRSIDERLVRLLRLVLTDNVLVPLVAQVLQALVIFHYDLEAGSRLHAPVVVFFRIGITVHVDTARPPVGVGREFQRRRRIAAELQNLLHASFSKGTFADDDGAFVVL